MTANRINLTTLSTAATRALAEQENTLRLEIAAARDDFHKQGNAMTIAELKERVQVGHYDDKPSTKSEWVGAYVIQQSKEHPAAKTLGDLVRNMHRDNFLAKAINDLLDDAEAADARLRKTVNDNSGKRLAYDLSWNIDEYFTAQEAALWAAQVVEGVNNFNAELREVALAVLRDAMQVLYGFPSHVRSNGLSNGLKLAEMAKAAAADRFRQCVTQNLNLPQVPGSLIH